MTVPAVALEWPHLFCRHIFLSARLCGRRLRDGARQIRGTEHLSGTDKPHLSTVRRPVENPRYAEETAISHRLFDFVGLNG